MIHIQQASVNDHFEIHRLSGRIRGIVQHPEHVYKIMAVHFGKTFYVARESDLQSSPIQGFMMGFVSQSIPGHLFVWQIAVSEEAHGKGIGTRLLEHTVTYARESGECTAVMATVETGNTGSQRLFEKMGFHIDSERFMEQGQELTQRGSKEAVTNYYGSGTDQIFYVLDVK
jgi:L-2,4-diaminobutyric acid acetyltransferase